MKLKYLFILFFLIHTTLIFCQSNNEKLVLDINNNMHGTGDMNGVYVNTQYSKMFSKKFDWFGEMGFSVNDLTYIDYFPGLENNDLRYEQRYVTAGLQFGGGISYRPLSKNSEVNIQLGPVVRYQSSSYPVSASTFSPTMTKLPIVVEHVNHGNEPLRTIALGGKLRLGYIYTFKKGFLIGANAHFQNDTNGDTMYSYGLTVGKRF